MLNNTRICPTCRSPLAANTCKKCGYKQKILKVVEYQQEFARRNYANKIQSSKREVSDTKLLTAEEKLSIYLKQYQKLIIKGVERIVEANQLNISLRQQFKKQVKNIWQVYLLRIKQNDKPFLGILKKTLNVESFIKANYMKQEQTVKQIKESNQEKQEQLDLKQPKQQQPEKKKRRRRSKSHHSQQHKVIPNSTKLRSYLIVTVKQCIKESIQQRKNGSNELTHAQKLFLSFILGLKQIDQQFLKIATNKYLKLILQIDGSKIQKTFVKQSIINAQIKKRNLESKKDRDKAISLIMLFDLLLCLSANNICSQNGVQLQQLLLYYRKNEPNQAIDLLLTLVNRQPIRAGQEQVVPQITYGLIYSILFLATTTQGLTVSIGQILTYVGALEVQKIYVDENISLPAILNQQAITSSKTRKTAHLLAKFLNLTFPVVITKWCRKWCTKFDILSELPLLSELNRLFFKQLLKKGLRKRPNLQQSDKHHNYFRFCELQQDIACLGSLVVYIKLIDGLTDYPYLINIKTQLLKKQYNFQEEAIQFEIVEKLIINKEITLQNTANGQKITKTIPQINRFPLDFLKLGRKVAQINQHDKHLGLRFNNFELIKLRYLSHINQVPSNQLLQAFTKFEQHRFKKHSEDQIKLRYDEVSHRNWSHQLVKIKKIKTQKVIKLYSKPKAKLNDDLIKQLGCFVSSEQKMINQTSDEKIQCLLDEPSANYQLMYEYSSDNLMLTQRLQQLYIMQQLCLNVCSYNQLVVWINSYESLLKKFETS